MTNSQKHLGWNLETKGSGKMGGGVCSSQEKLRKKKSEIKL